MSNIIRYYMEDKGEVKGFLAINFKKNLPHLQHIYLNKKHRGVHNIRNLKSVIFNIVKKLGFDKFLLHARNERQLKLARYYFNAKPYGIKNNIAWFVVKI